MPNNKISEGEVLGMLKIYDVTFDRLLKDIVTEQDKQVDGSSQYIALLEEKCRQHELEYQRLEADAGQCVENLERLRNTDQIRIEELLNRNIDGAAPGSSHKQIHSPMFNPGGHQLQQQQQQQRSSQQYSEDHNVELHQKQSLIDDYSTSSSRELSQMFNNDLQLAPGHIPHQYGSIAPSDDAGPESDPFGEEMDF